LYSRGARLESQPEHQLS